MKTNREKEEIANKAPFIDAVIEKGVLFLLIFTPLAFGTVQQWSVSVMELTAFSIFYLLFLKRDFVIQKRHSLTYALIFFFSLVGLVIVQLLPLPNGLLKVISPSALEVYKKFGTDAEAAFHSMSLNSYATEQELLKLLSYGAVFFVVVCHYRTKAQLKSIAKTIVYAGCCLALFAIIQRIFWNGRIYWFYSIDENLRSGVGIWGPYINRNHFAGYMEMTIPLGLGLLLYSAPESKALPGVPVSRKVTRFLASDNIVSFALFFLLVMVMSASLLMTLSRGGIMAFGVSSLFFIWITRSRRSLKKKAVSLLLLSAVILVPVMLASWERLEQRFEELPQERQVHRLMVWKDSLGMVKDFPVFGTGLGTFENNYMRYQSKESQVLYDHAHNDYLELLTDTGLIGFLVSGGLFFLFFFSVFKAWHRKRNMFGKCLGAGGLSSCVAIGVHSFTDFNLHIPANALLFTVICGITYAAIFNMSEGKGSHALDSLEYRNSPSLSPACRPDRSSASRLTSYVLLSLSLCLLYFPVRDLIADHYYGRVADILDDKATEELDVKPISESTMPSYIAAISTLKKASALSPSRSVFSKELSDLYSGLGRWAETMESLKSPPPAVALSKEDAFGNAIKHIQKAVSLEPTNPDYHLALGELYDAVHGDAARADAEIIKAIEAFPVNAPLRYSVAMHYLLTGRQGDALEQARLLAMIDDSYIIPESTQKTLMIERRTSDYLSTLYNSYLFKALEIAWRVSRDPHVVKGIAPDTADAREVVQAFMEWKGIE